MVVGWDNWASHHPDVTDVEFMIRLSHDLRPLHSSQGIVWLSNNSVKKKAKKTLFCKAFSQKQLSFFYFCLNYNLPTGLQKHGSQYVPVFVRCWLIFIRTTYSDPLCVNYVNERIQPSLASFHPSPQQPRQWFHFHLINRCCDTN